MSKKNTKKEKMDIVSLKTNPQAQTTPSLCEVDQLYIVAIGASAGGLETLKTLFLSSQPNPRIAFVVVTHLSHDHISLLSEILQQYTKMQTVTISNHLEVKANHIYVLPPGKNVYIQKGILYLADQKDDKELNLPIDFFLRSLANDINDKAICVILSGTGSDGTIGLRSIREKNGLVIVQTVKSARYDGMPKSAINTGLVDYILSPEEIFEFIVKYLQHAKDKNIHIEKSISDQIQQVLMMLHTQTGHDFSSYKTNTIFRRIQKRMNILQLDTLTA